MDSSQNDNLGDTGVEVDVTSTDGMMKLGCRTLAKELTVSVPMIPSFSRSGRREPEGKEGSGDNSFLHFFPLTVVG